MRRTLTQIGTTAALLIVWSASLALQVRRTIQAGSIVNRKPFFWNANHD